MVMDAPLSLHWPICILWYAASLCPATLLLRAGLPHSVECQESILWDLNKGSSQNNCITVVLIKLMTLSTPLHDFINHGCDSRAAIELLHLVPLIYTHVSGVGLPFATDPVPADCLAANWSCAQSTFQLSVHVTIVSIFCLPLPLNFWCLRSHIYSRAFTPICRYTSSSFTNLSPGGWYDILIISWDQPRIPTNWRGPGNWNQGTGPTGSNDWHNAQLLVSHLQSSEFG